MSLLYLRKARKLMEARVAKGLGDQPGKRFAARKTQRSPAFYARPDQQPELFAQTVMKRFAVSTCPTKNSQVISIKLTYQTDKRRKPKSKRPMS